MWTASVDSARTAASPATTADSDSIGSSVEFFPASSSTTGEGSCKSCCWVGNVSRWQGGARLSAMTDDELLAHGIRRSMLDRAAWLDSLLAAGNRRRNAPTFDEAPVTARPTTAGARGPAPRGAADAASGIDGPHGKELADDQDRAANRMTASATHVDEGQQSVLIIPAMRSSSPEPAAVATVTRPEGGGLNTAGPAGQAGHESERARRARLCREAAEKRAER